jgi:hypothetical protein
MDYLLALKPGTKLDEISNSALVPIPMLYWRVSIKFLAIGRALRYTKESRINDLAVLFLLVFVEYLLLLSGIWLKLVV